MELLLKEIYENIEWKLSCPCLAYNDMKNIVLEYVQEDKPWLNRAEAVMETDRLLNTSLKMYKDQRCNLVQTLRRSVKGILNSEPVCNCYKNTTFSAFGLGQWLCCGEPDKSSGEKECNCYNTCIQQEERKAVLEPLLRLISKNRSFKLRMKHLYPARYDLLNADVNTEGTKDEEGTIQVNECPLRMKPPEKGSQTQIKESSIPIIKDTAKSTKIVKDSLKELQTDFNHARIEDSVNGNITGILKGDDQILHGPQYKEKSNQTTKEEQSAISSQYNNQCLRCLLEEYLEVEQQPLYCEVHCPKCTSPNTKETEGKQVPSKTSTSYTRKHSHHTSGVLTQTNPGNRSTNKLKTSRGLRSTLVDEVSMKRATRRKEVENKENTSAKSPGITRTRVGKDEAQSATRFRRVLSKELDSKVSLNFNNTINTLDHLKNSHIDPIKKELLELEKSLERLKLQYKL